MLGDEIVFRASLMEMAGLSVLIVLTIIAVIASHTQATGSLGRLALLTKVLSVGVMSFLLCKPEWKRTLPVEDEPSLLVMRDRTPSMQTADERGESDVRVRDESVEEFLASEEWMRFVESSGLKVEVKDFGGAETLTDLDSVLAAELGLSPSGVLLLSDGAWNTGAPPARVAQQYADQGSVIYGLTLGAEQKMPDLSLEVKEAPVIVETEEAFELIYRVVSSFPQAVTCQLRVKSGERVILQRDLLLEPREEQVISVLHEIPSEGEEVLVAELMSQESETLVENNRTETEVTARALKMRVLLVDTLPRWEYRFIRNAMIRDEKVEVSCLLLHPDLGPGEGPHYITEFPELAELSKYDVILLGDIGVAEGQLSDQEVSNIAEVVRHQATGLILLPGSAGAQESLVKHKDLGGLYPVLFDQEMGGAHYPYASHLKLSQEGESSLLMNLSAYDNALVWEGLPGFTWYQPCLRLKAGATALAYHDKDRNAYGAVPLVVTSRAGRGKVLYMGIDSSWKWRRGVEDRYHYRFWRQMSRWMAYQRSLTEGEQARLFLSQESPTEGDRLRLSLQAMNKDGRPADRELVRLLISSPGEREQIIPLVPTGQWGTFEGEQEIRTAGAHQLAVEIGGERVAERTFTAQKAARETVGDPAEPEVMEELARITGGKAMPFAMRASMLTALEEVASPPLRYEFSPLAHQWGWYVALVGLLVLSWILRRLSTGD